MWQRLMHWLPDVESGGKVSVGDMLQVVFSITGAFLALVAIVYAWRVAKRQFQMMDEQGVIVGKQLAAMHEQATILVRMERLEENQGEIAGRQAAIAEKQHQLLEAQLAKRED